MTKHTNNQFTTISHLVFIVIMGISLLGCNAVKNNTYEVYETSASGKSLEKIKQCAAEAQSVAILIDTTLKYQTITGFGGSFTESSAHVLSKISKANRKRIIEAYFSQQGANYSLTRTHMGSCDFSLGNYTYAKVPFESNLASFSIEEDKQDLIPLITEAAATSEDGFKIIASPWTCPPWMKDNQQYVGGKLLPQYYDAFALYFVKYLEAYKKEGINIWGVTVINEPHGNGNNWESTHFTPEEMTFFVQHHLGPKLASEGWNAVQLLGYDQNRAGLKKWIDVMYKDDLSTNYYDGTAIHWYESTYDHFPLALQYACQRAPNKFLIQTEACIDSQVPKWKDDIWYWSKEATDWGYKWASDTEKYLHPMYVPVHRYATDIIGCLNNGVDGWIDWNLVLDKQGGPNWFKNWCTAPVIVDPEKDEVYFTPLYYVMAHFSKFMRPGAQKISCNTACKEILTTAVKNPDGSLAVVVFNPTLASKKIVIQVNEQSIHSVIDASAIQTVLIR